MRLAAAAFAVATVAAAGVAGCGRESAPPIAPPAPPPPELLATSPPVRGTRVLPGTPIWVSFREPLDPATVNDHTVFLKLDTQRVPATVTLGDEGHRISIVPTVPLKLGRTHTVWLSDAIETANGGRFAEAYFWQFRMIGVRLPDPQAPVAGPRTLSPFTTLAWAETEASAGPVRYLVFAGPDSLAVASRAVAPLEPVTIPFYMPRDPWTYGGVTYWSVTAVNDGLGESLDGAVSSFTVVPQTARIDSLVISTTRDWGYRTPDGATFCGSNVINAGSGYTGLLRWNLASYAGLELARARIEVSMTFLYSGQSPGLSFWPIPITPSCGAVLVEPPAVIEGGGPLGGFASRISDHRLMLASNLLTAQMQAMLQGLPMDGHVLRARSTVGLESPTTIAGSRRPELKLYFYRDVPRP